jgi:Flp pilus assembly protein TadD
MTDRHCRFARLGWLTPGLVALSIGVCGTENQPLPRAEAPADSINVPAYRIEAPALLACEDARPLAGFAERAALPAQYVAPLEAAGPQPVETSPAKPLAAYRQPQQVVVKSVRAVEGPATPQLPVPAPLVARAVPHASMGPQPQATFRPARPRGQRAPHMATVLDQANLHNAQGFDLANRGAFFSARAEFIQSLRLLSQGLDVESDTTQYSQALAAGLRALKEAEDFDPRGSRLESDLNLADLINTHRTPVLKGTNIADVSPPLALGAYYTYAQQQFATAVAGESVGSLALHALGKLHGVLATQKLPAMAALEPKAIVFHGAALIAAPDNYVAANDLAVLLAKAGRYQDAKNLLLKSVSLSPQPATWHNLAVVHERLGENALAQAANKEAQAGVGTSQNVNTPALMALQSVRWVNPTTFANATQPSTEVSQPPAAAAPTVAETKPAGEPIRSASRWFPLNTRQQ